MCLLTNDSELCNHVECLRYYSAQRFSMENNSMIISISNIIQQQSLVLTDLAAKNNILNQKLEILNQKINKATHIQSISTEEQFNLEGIFSYLASGKEFSMFINLLNEIPTVIFKEKGFDIIVNVLDTNARETIIPVANPFNIALFTKENPPKLLKTNISGRKILRGTNESVTEYDGKIRFHNIVINEVTSHYPNDSFCLVILCPSLAHIKPLIINGISVRARKHKKE